MTTDFCKAGYKAFKSIYENIRIDPFFSFDAKFESTFVSIKK